MITLKQILPGIMCLWMALPAAANRGGIDVVVPVSPGLTTGTGNAAPSVPPCSRCCVYQNQYYSEGAVVNAEGVVLQCRQNENVTGTNNLRWEILKKR